MMLVCASVRECLLSGDEEPPGGHKLRGLAYSESDPRPVQIPDCERVAALEPKAVTSADPPRPHLMLR